MAISRGVVRDALHGVLADAYPTALPLEEIHRRVELRLGREVPQSSLRSGILHRIPGTYERRARGTYRLVGTDAASLPEDLDRPPDSFTVGRATLHRSEAIAWLLQAETNSIHAVVTDPPYGLVEYRPDQQRKLKAGRGGVWRLPPSYDGHKRSPLPRFSVLRETELADLERFFRRFADALYPKLVPGAHLMIASNPLVSFRVAYAISSAGFERRGEVIRLVQTMRGGDRPKNAHEKYADVSVMPRSQWEPWLLFRKPLMGTVAQNLERWGTGGLRRTSESQPFGDVIRSGPARPHERAIAPHPSLKPQALMRQLVRAALPLGEGIVLDPFAGSGATLAACEAVGYASVGTEVSEEYFSLAKEAITPLAALQLG
jgi:site-specific DNA-methyltransferase (adenine-specific)